MFELTACVVPVFEPTRCVVSVFELTAYVVPVFEFTACVVPVSELKASVLSLSTVPRVLYTPLYTPNAQFVLSGRCFYTSLMTIFVQERNMQLLNNSMYNKSSVLNGLELY